MSSIPALRTRGDLRLLVVAITMLVVLVAAERASAVDRIQRTGMLNGTVLAISGPDADGNRYLGGDFTAFSPWATGNGAVVDTSTGAVDPSFPRVVSALSSFGIYDVEPDGTGGAFIGGNFNQVDGQARNGLAHILADGSLDTSWTAGLSSVSSSSYVLDIELAGDVLYVVGRFTGVVGTADPRYNAAAFDRDTGAVANWNPALEITSSRLATSIAVSGSQAFIGGNFTCLNARVSGNCGDTGSVSRLVLAAVNTTNGDAVQGFDAEITGGAAVETLALSPAGSPVGSARGDWLYFGGRFSTVRGETRQGAAVIRTDGTDTLGAWAPNIGSFNTVFDLAINGSSIYLAGDFYSLTPAGGSSTPRNLLAEVSLDPTQNAVIQPLDLFDSATNMAVRDLHIEGGNLYLGGLFSKVGGLPRNDAAKVSLAGVVDPWNPAIADQFGSGVVYAIAPFGSKVLLGGRFSEVGGESRVRAAAVDEDGYLTDWAVNLNSSVNAVAVADGKVFVGGEFTTANGATRNRAAAFDASGTLDPNWNPAPDGRVRAMTTVGSTVYLGGDFTSVTPSSGSAYRPYAAAFSTSGVLDPDWKPSLNSRVYAMTAVGSTVYLGGSFTLALWNSALPQQQRNYAAAFSTSGTLDPNWNPDLNDWVLAMTALDSTVYVGGQFTRTSSSSTWVGRNRVAAFSTSGTLESWNPGSDNIVYALSGAGSTVYLGGTFANIGGGARANVAAVSTAGVLQSWAPNPNGNILALGANPETGTAYLGGTFSSISGGTARSFSSAVSAAGTLLDPWPRLGPPTLYALSVTKQGSGSGTVTSSPAGIDCGATCSTSVRAGRSVTLTAAAAAGSTFAGWGGACSGTTATCAVTMDQARSVTAEFSAPSSPGASGTTGSDASPVSPTKKSSLRVVAARGQGQEVVVGIRASGPGRVSAAGTVAGAGASRTVVCTAAKQVRAAGVARLLCRLNATGRGLLARQALSVRVAVTYRPASGTTRRAVRTVRLAQLTPSPTPVTG